MNELTVYHPYDRSTLRSYTLKTAQEGAAILERMRSLKPLARYERLTILERAARLMQSDLEPWVRLIVSEGGKPVRDARIEARRAVEGIKFAAAYLRFQSGKETPMDLTRATAQRTMFSFCEPAGPVLAVSAFNHPLNLAVHQAVPAVAVGAPVLLKPALTTPGAAFALRDLFLEAGLPPGYFEVLVCDNAATAELAQSRHIARFSFIGSSAVGWTLRSSLAPGVEGVFEHGGAAPVVVEPDADLDTAVSILLHGGYYHAGQVCVSVQRVFIHKSVYDRFAEKFSSAVRALRWGDPFDEATVVGPLITPAAVARVRTLVENSLAAGAELLAGGVEHSSTVYAPTLLGKVPQNAPLMQEEVFGPVVALDAYSDLEEAVNRANGLHFAFQAAVFTRDLERAFFIARRLKAAAVVVNDSTAFRADWAPFGGYEDSGLGFGGIPQTMDFYSRVKTLVFRHETT
ncbi:MAG: aldehyde dehydrogenase family protein [Bacteroidia bacterium]|nr:aldehyde dehydrogenase family protein [Bacteroidia bacterium]